MEKVIDRDSVLAVYGIDIDTVPALRGMRLVDQPTEAENAAGAQAGDLCLRIIIPAAVFSNDIAAGGKFIGDYADSVNPNCRYYFFRAL